MSYDILIPYSRNYTVKKETAERAVMIARNRPRNRNTRRPKCVFSVRYLATVLHFSSSSRWPILRASRRERTCFPSSIVVGTEEIGSNVLFVPRASSAGKAISRSDPPIAEYRPLKSQPRSWTRARACARHERVLHFPSCPR